MKTNVICFVGIMCSLLFTACGDDSSTSVKFDENLSSSIESSNDTDSVIVSSSSIEKNHQVLLKQKVQVH